MDWDYQLVDQTTPLRLFYILQSLLPSLEQVALAIFLDHHQEGEKVTDLFSQVRRVTIVLTEDLASHQLFELPQGISDLEAEAITEGFRFLTRLVDEWQSAANRFDGPGECLVGGFLNGRLIAVGGLTRDPHAGPETGRLRRLYVAPWARGQGVGRCLVQQLLQRASQQFQVVRLFTDTPQASAFYLRCGFREIEDEFATHLKPIKKQGGLA